MTSNDNCMTSNNKKDLTKNPICVTIRKSRPRPPGMVDNRHPQPTAEKGSVLNGLHSREGRKDSDGPPARHDARVNRDHGRQREESDPDRQGV